MRPRTATRGIALVLLAVIIALASFGSRAESKRNFVARAMAICAGASRAIHRVAPAAAGGASLPALGRYLSVVTPLVDAEVKQLRSLPRPTVDRSLLGRYLAAVASEAGDYRVLATAARRGDRAEVTSATAALRASPATTLAARYGLSACASGTVVP